MSDFRTQPAVAVRDEAEASGQDESGSSSTAQKPENGRSGLSFWSRAARLWRSGSSSTIREDLADALMTDPGADAAFSPAERAMLNNILRFREVRVEDVMVPRADI